MQDYDRYRGEKRRRPGEYQDGCPCEYLSSITPLTPEEKKDIPNIIFILMDDLGWGTVLLWIRAIHTPNLDRMAGRVILDNCYSSSPVFPQQVWMFDRKVSLQRLYPQRILPTVEMKKGIW